MTPRLRLFFAVAMLISASRAVAAEETRILGGEMRWSAVRTELEKEAVGFVAEFSPALNAGRYFRGPGGIGYLGPTFELRTGSEDTFQSVLAKAAGFWMLTPADDPEDPGEPDYTHNWIHIFPFSIGLEADRDFQTPAVLGEVGWTPIGRRTKIDPDKPSERFGLDPLRNLGIFLQAGYKIDNTDSSNVAAAAADSGGRENESEEKPDEAITRLKAMLTYGYAFSDRVSMIPRAAGWFDVLSQEFYYQIEAVLRVVLVQNRYAWDFRYEKGSGAPTFNEGDQFSAGLAIAF